MRWTKLAGVALITAVVGLTSSALAQGRNETLLVVTELGPNSMDIHGVGANRPSYQASWNLYDRLITYGVKTLPDGSKMYDYSVLKPELAESWQVAPDGMSVTLKLRRDAKFHDGTPVTARDVKWSFDRAVTVGGFPTFQMKAGSLEKPEQFEVVDDHTFRITFLRKDRLTLPDIAVPVPVIINSELAKKHATAERPLGDGVAQEQRRGRRRVQARVVEAGQETVFVRYDDWKSGPLPKLRKVIVREVPVRGQPARAARARRRRHLVRPAARRTSTRWPRRASSRWSASPSRTRMSYVGMNVKTPPFDNVKVRQAVAYAIPYEKIMDAATYGRGIKLYGGDLRRSGTRGLAPADPVQDRHRQGQGAHRGGGHAERLRDHAVLRPGLRHGERADGRADPGIARPDRHQDDDQQDPGRELARRAPQEGDAALLNAFGGWLNYPEYFFFWNYHGQNAVFNTMSLPEPGDGQADRRGALRDRSRRSTRRPSSRASSRWPSTDVPRVPLYQPNLDVAMQKSITGYQYWFHRQLDFRQITKG